MCSLNYRSMLFHFASEVDPSCKMQRREMDENWFIVNKCWWQWLRGCSWRWRGQRLLELYRKLAWKTLQRENTEVDKILWGFVGGRRSWSQGENQVRGHKSGKEGHARTKNTEDKQGRKRHKETQGDRRRVGGHGENRNSKAWQQLCYRQQGGKADSVDLHLLPTL